MESFIKERLEQQCSSSTGSTSVELRGDRVPTEFCRPACNGWRAAVLVEAGCSCINGVQ